MQTILRILKQAGGWHHGLYLKIENPPYMALVIEATDESGPCGLPSISVAHYGEQNGDLMRDPEMCFELGFIEGPHLSAFYYRNDYVGVEQWSRTSSMSDSPRCGTTTCVSRALPKPSSGRSRAHAPNPFPAPERIGKRVRSTTLVQCNR
jgi:hypothetical protein